MKEEAAQSPFTVGQYLDYCNAQNQWVPRIVIGELQSPSRERVLKIKDPRYTITASQNIAANSPKLQPYRTHTALKPSAPVNISYLTKWRRFEAQNLANRQTELQEFTSRLLEKTPHQMIQFLRGHHYFYGDELINSQFNEQFQYAATMRFLAAHRTLFTHYLRALDFRQADQDIYASPVSALCSAFPEMLEWTTYAVGIAMEFDAIKKDCARWHDQAAFQRDVTEWVEKELFPALLDSKHEGFPPNLLFGLFCLLNSLFSRLITSKSQQLPVIYEMLYEDLIKSLKQPISLKELNQFETNCDSIFRCFPLNNVAESSYQSSQTEQIDMAIERSPHSSASRDKDRSKEAEERDELVRMKKMQFKFHLAQGLYQKNELDRFIRQVSSMVLDVYRKLTDANYDNQSQWPSFVKYFVKMALNCRLVEGILGITGLNQETHIRNIIMKMHFFLPDHILQLVVEHEKLLLLRHLLQRSNQPIVAIEFTNMLVDRIIAKSATTDSPKEYLDFYNFLERHAKDLYSAEVARSLRVKLINASFDIAAILTKNENRTLIDNIFDLNDPLRDQLWAAYTLQHILPYANDHYSYFFEISINKYLHRFNVGLSTFTEICEFMKDSDIRDQKYQKRKNSVMAALNFQYRHHKERYLQYLEVFLESFCDENHDKSQHDWIDLYPFPKDDKNFWTLPINKDFCYHMDNLRPLYYETDIFLYLKLFLKLNVLQGKVTINSEGQITSVLDVPDSFSDLLSCLYTTMSTVSRSKMIEKEVEKYFYAAQDPKVYNLMLVDLLNTIISHNAKRIQVNTLFRRLKTRIHQIPKTAVYLASSTPKAEENLICKNVKIVEKCQQLIKKLELDELFLPLFQEERNKIKIDIPLYRTQLLKTIRVRIGSRLFREPADIILLLDGKPLQQEKYNLSFQDVYYHIDPDSPKGLATIEYQLNSCIPPIRDMLLNKIANLIDLLPNSLALMKGIDIIQEDWESVVHLQTLKKNLQSNLQHNDLMESDLKVTQKFDLLLDFYIWKLDREQYSFRPLIKFFKRIEGTQFVMRNFKIAYLLYQSRETYYNFQQCEQIMLSLLPDATMNPEKQEKILDIINSNKNYQSLQKIVCFLIEKAPNSLTFISTCRLYNEFQQFNLFSQIYRRLWIKIYLQTPIQEKIEFFKNFEHFMVFYPDNMRDFYTIISQEQIARDNAFYQDLVAKLTIILLRLNKANLTLNQVKSIEILISNISELSDESKVFHPILHSKELAEFVKNHIYQLSERTQKQLLNLMRIMVDSQQSRAILTDFFARQTREQEWIAKPILFMKSLSKTPQLEGRVGLKNPHSVCYANSFLQQLYHIDIFRDEMLETPFTQNSSPQQDIIYQLKKIFLNLHYGREAYFNPDFFKAFKNFDGEQTNIQIQMDVDEFRNLLFDRIEHSIPSTNNFVNKIFNGKQKTIIKSQQCQHVSSKNAEVFSSLCVDVKGCKNLEQSLDLYFKPQILNGDNAYFCDQCKKKLSAQKTIQIESLPPYLTFVLKRFEYGALVRSKINSYFQFPFDGFQYFPGKKYKLKGVIVHIGVAQAGHYVSFAKHNQVWYLFNDGIVTEADQQRVKEVSFGVNPKTPGYNRQQSKNAYVIIYEAEDAPRRQASLQRNYYGVTDEYRRIVKNRILSNKERIYFSAGFLQTLNNMAEKHSEPATLHLLFWNLFSIHVRMKQPTKYEVLRKSFAILKRNKNVFASLWSQNQIERVIQVFTCHMSPQYKSILIQVLVDNCQQYCPNVERILQICLKKIYQEKDNTGYYMFMHLMAKKFGQVCKYLNKQRIVGRVLDILYLGIIGQKIRSTLKNSCDVEFQMISFNSRTFKQVQRACFRYHKWALVTTVLEYCNFDLHEIEKQHYVFQNTYINLGHLTAEAADKPSIKYVSKYFSIVCKHNNDYFTKLIQYITEQLKDKDDCRKYMKILKDLCFIQDELTDDRNRTTAILFQKYLRRLYEQKKEQIFILAWQWFIEITKKNFFFRKIIKQHIGLFQFTSNVNANNFGIYRNRFQDSHSKLNHTKHQLYGIIGPSALRQTQLLVDKKNAEMSHILKDENEIHDTNDYDGEIVQNNLEDGQIILKYDDFKTKFAKVAVQFSYGDLLIIQMLDKSHWEKQNGGGLIVCSRGDQKLRLKTVSIPDELVMEPNAEPIQSEEPSNHTSIRQI